MTEREKQGGIAALTALVKTPLQGAIGADGHSQQDSSSNASSNGNGKSSNGSSSSSSSVLPPEAFVWVQPAGQRASR
jgi:hypothetical protein